MKNESKRANAHRKPLMYVVRIKLKYIRQNWLVSGIPNSSKTATLPSRFFKGKTREELNAVSEPVVMCATTRRLYF